MAEKENVGKRFKLREDKLSVGKGKRLYGRKGELVEVIREAEHVLLVKNVKTGETFSVNKNDIV